MTEEEDKLLRASVPERWKGTASPIGAVQNYIAELERAIADEREACAKAAKAALEKMDSTMNWDWVEAAVRYRTET